MSIDAHSIHEEVLTLPAFAARVGMPENQARALAHLGLIPGVNRNGGTGHFRVPAWAVDQFDPSSVQPNQASGSGASPAGRIPPGPAPQDGGSPAETPAGPFRTDEESDHDDR